MFKDAAFEMHYRYKEPNNGGIVIIGIRQGGNIDYIELEIPWDWLPAEIKNTRSLGV